MDFENASSLVFCSPIYLFIYLLILNEMSDLIVFILSRGARCVNRSGLRSFRDRRCLASHVPSRVIPSSRGSFYKLRRHIFYVALDWLPLACSSPTRQLYLSLFIFYDIFYS